MATTFKAVVYADNKRQDGTYNVKIRLTHRRQTLKLSTNIYVASHQLTRSLKIKDQSVIDATTQIIMRWRSIVGALGAVADSLTAKQIVEHIQREELRKQAFSLDFIEYMRKVGAQLHAGTGKNYAATANALARYTDGTPLDISGITVRMLSDFEKFLRNEPSQRGRNRKTGTSSATKGERAVSLYMGIIRATHNKAKEEFNDEEMGLIRIPRSPFAKYSIPTEDMPRKRAITADCLQRIIDLPDEPIADSRRNTARDCFLLSFGLAGMNAADLLSCPAQSLKDEVIIYNRQKTASRRSDKAEMHIRIEPQIAPLVEKYKDPTGTRLFRFHLQYASGDTFNNALNEGLKRIDAALRTDTTGIAHSALPDHITFYAARHSWATIARSAALGIDKYTVHEALNHVDSMKITDRYIDRDWSVIWNANAAVISLFDWSEVRQREEKRK